MVRQTIKKRVQLLQLFKIFYNKLTGVAMADYKEIWEIDQATPLLYGAAATSKEFAHP